MFLFLTVVQALIAAALVGVILMQQSEGGGLGVGGSPSGLMSARGAANFLTRATAILAVLFVALSIVLAALAVDQTTGRDIDTSLQRNTAPADPLAGSADKGAAAADNAAPAAPAPADDPLSGAAKQ
ncbi:preprotein translocase subunit SecG [Novosphingobium mangrovi (ex Huang et al. 2023)]|uniref:Protein-export membrane protein SecG n=1 Tax=Novosphingobium mangrovi (ex Huang et al. 2023) TaxID=2976432 RepID=A0ABT2I3Y8_9SPHN|nr:preprotein translocase subunit SecG [Novosphingobium mangrovi (ex Huang et al. 2023)]MCT2399529.1 preprotein translocase subunit SecG [Novosphingobium mangrovi (ex Huang et al. 2023)]